MVGKGYSVVVLPTTSSRRPDDKAETSRRLTLVLGKTKQSPRENKKRYFKKRYHLISNQMVTETQENEPRYGTRTKKKQTPLPGVKSRGVCIFPQNYNREFIRARYLPMMSNSRFTTVPTWKVWKLVCSKV